MGREDFLRIPELAINPLGDRIVHAFCTLDNTSGEDQVQITLTQTYKSHIQLLTIEER